MILKGVVGWVKQEENPILITLLRLVEIPQLQLPFIAQQLEFILQLGIIIPLQQIPTHFLTERVL